CSYNTPDRSDIHTLSLHDALPILGNARARNLTIAVTSSSMGRLAATTIMAKTNAGSVKLRVSIYSTADPMPTNTAMKQISTKAQTPNTASTSDSIFHRPE